MNTRRVYNVFQRQYPYESISAANGSAQQFRFGRLRCWGKNTGHDSANTIGDNNNDEFFQGDTQIGADDVDVLAVDVHWNQPTVLQAVNVCSQ